MKDKGYLLALTAFYAASLALVNPATRGDGFHYFAHLRSAVLDHDLDVRNELPYADAEHRAYTVAVVAREGRFVNKFAVGSAALWAPSYVAVHYASVALARAGGAVRADGFAPQYLWAVAFATATYVFAGVLLVYRLVRSYYGAGVAFAVALGIWFATSLPAYALFHPTMAHGPSFFTAALFLFVWHETRGRQDLGRAAAVGAAAGFAAMVRTQDALVLLIPAVEYVAAGVAAARRRDGARVRQLAASAATCGAAAVLFFSPQLAAWRLTTGSWLRTGYENSFRWTRPALAAVLFSTNHGAILWTPILGVAVAGLIAFARRAPAVAAAAAATFVLQLYVVAAWGCWWQASSFGGRMLVSTYPLLAFGLAAAAAPVVRRLGVVAVIAAVGLLILWNANLLFQFGTGMIPRDGPVPPALVAANSGRVPGELVRFAVRYFARRDQVRRTFLAAE